MRFCGHCGDLSAHDAETCESCGWDLVWPTRYERRRVGNGEAGSTTNSKSAS